jgi:hypothetical protein
MPIVGSFAGASARAYGLQTGTVVIPGMDLISTQTFSAVTSVNFDNVFSNTYVQYKIVIDATTTTGTYGSVRLRVGGVTNSSGIYNRQYFYAGSTTVAGARSTSGTSWDGIGASDGTSRMMGLFEIMNPFQTMYTSAFYLDNYARSLQEINLNALGTTATTSFDGFTFLNLTGGATFTGSISVYGFYKGA